MSSLKVLATESGFPFLKAVTADLLHGDSDCGGVGSFEPPSAESRYLTRPLVDDDCVAIVGIPQVENHHGWPLPDPGCFISG
jgi:hypothetical protein